MSLIKRAYRWLADVPKAISYAVGVNNGLNYFSPVMRDRARLEKYRTIYSQAGIPAQAIDVYALFMLSPGIKLVSDDDAAKKLVEDEFKRMKMTRTFWLAITRSLNYGDSFQEIVPYQRQAGISRIVHRWPGSFNIITDDRGDLTGYEQVTDDGKKVPLDKEIIIHLALIPGDDIYGVSLTGRAYDEILNDAKVSTGTSIAIERHGTGKHHWTLGDENNPAGTSDITEWKDKLRTLKSDSDIVTTHLFQVKEMDTGGVPNAQQYSDVFLQRLCAAFGVPGELLGLRIGTTDATAVTRIDAFFRQVETFQQTLAETYQPVVDAIVGQPGIVTLSFNDASPGDEKARAEWVTMLMNANKLDPFWIGEQWVRDQFDIPEPPKTEQPAQPAQPAERQAGHYHEDKP